jgi:TatD DNase family protein
MQFTDSHCHLDDTSFQQQLPELLQQCQNLSIRRIIIPAISPDNFDNVLNLAKTHHDNPIKLYPCLGIHPWYLANLNEAHLSQFTNKIIKEQHNIIGLGEIGIDGANIKRSNAPEKELAKQQHFFDYQLNLAKEYHLPVVIHHRQSHDKIVPFLKKYQLERAGVIHGFSGSFQQAKDYLDLGFKLGIGSTITYSRAKKTINTLKRVPIDSLLLETDAPAMPLSKDLDNTVIENQQHKSPHLSEPAINYPLKIIQIFNVLTQIREESANDIAQQLEQNVDQLFFAR